MASSFATFATTQFPKCDQVDLQGYYKGVLKELVSKRNSKVQISFKLVETPQINGLKIVKAYKAMASSSDAKIEELLNDYSDILLVDVPANTNGNHPPYCFAAFFSHQLKESIDLGFVASQNSKSLVIKSDSPNDIQNVLELYPLSLK